MEENDQQELMMKFSVFEQQIRNLQEQLEAVEHAIVESEAMHNGLDELKDSKNKEVMASIGKGIFIKAKVISEDLIVDVGSKKFVKKTIPETQELIKKQVKKLEEIKEEIESNMDNINKELTEFFAEAQGKGKTST
jgi:prefoldin alpha subunit